jgi:hypothetical protein
MPAPAIFQPNELQFLLVDSATVYAVNPDTDAYTVLVLGPFSCRLSFKRGGSPLGTGIGGVTASYFHVMYPAAVALPSGYWEMEIAGVRYTPRANSGTAFRDPDGNVLWRGVDVDQVGYTTN